MEKKTILIIFGGYSTEYYVSCNSASGIIDSIDKTLFNILKLGISIEGEWIFTNATAEEIKDGVSWLKHVDNKSALISPNRNEKKLLVFEDYGLKEMDIDCVFPIIHGYGGEDGSIQGLLEVANIPYVGSNIAASANSIDKQLTRMFANNCGLKQPACIVLDEEDYEINKNVIEELIDFEYPLFVKPASLGSSVGITRVDAVSQLEKAIEEAFRYEKKILIEEGIIGTEIKVSVLGNRNLVTGEICELKVPENEINDYETKYVKCSSIKNIPANIPDAISDEAKRQACLIYHELDCKGFARVDFFLNKKNELYFNEINTVPGFGENSIFTLMFEKAGMSYKDIITKLIYLALEDSKQVSETSQELFKSIF